VYKNLARIKFLKFLVVGGGAFCLDVSLFTFFYHWLDVNVYVARALAFMAAVVVTWSGNRRYTFKSSECIEPFQQFLRASLAAFAAVIPNYGVFILVIKYTEKFPGMELVALISGIVVGIFFNYNLSRKWVFR